MKIVLQTNIESKVNETPQKYRIVLINNIMKLQTRNVLMGIGILNRYVKILIKKYAWSAIGICNSNISILKVGSTCSTIEYTKKCKKQEAQ